MKDEFDKAAAERTVMLAKEELLRVAAPARLRVVRGQVWLTVDGQPHDHMLEPGDQFVLERGTRALAQAIFGPACAVVADEVPAAWPKRARHALRTATHRLAEVFA
ncbi:MAG: DUF2917 domain-containing protein [Variovorax sp.]